MTQGRQDSILGEKLLWGKGRKHVEVRAWDLGLKIGLDGKMYVCVCVGGGGGGGG